VRERPSAPCTALLTELSGYIDQELPPAERRALEAHLAACGCCDMLARRLEAVAAWCRRSAGPRMPADVRRRARARVAALLASSCNRS
jgi:anti-sigma factor RsiW